MKKLSDLKHSKISRERKIYCRSWKQHAKISVTTTLEYATLGLYNSTHMTGYKNYTK
jgi:hypothetical protein